jgi:hypothetical protein
MNRQTVLASSIVLLAAVLVSPRELRADSLNVTPVQASQTVAQGTTVVTFYATITNPSTTDTVYLNGDSSSTGSPDLTLDDSPFNTNAPLFLPPLASSGGMPFALFNVDLALDTPAGTYDSNTFSITGGPDGGTYTDFDDLVDVDFSVTVIGPASTVPEPGTSLLLVCGLALLASASRRTNRSPRETT